jgi:hypothetical protein
MKKFITKFIDILCLLVGIHGSEVEKSAIESGAVSFEGQGRDKYGN